MARAVDADNERDSDRVNGRDRQRNGLSAARAATLAQEQLERLTGRSVEAVSGLSRQQGGWTVTVELVELERKPKTTDILATYRVELDAGGELMGYERVSRYYRNQTGEGA
jgi:hypothetical protein